MTARRLGVLIEQLLGDSSSALARAVDPDGGVWSMADHMRADLYDALVHGLVKGVPVQGRDPDQPEAKRYPRPVDIRAAQQRLAALQAQAERTRRRLEGGGGG